MSEKELENIRIIGLPKGSILWPTFAFAFIGGIIGLITNSNTGVMNVISGLFLIVATFNIIILFFDFSRGSIFGIFGLIIAIIVLLVNFHVTILSSITSFLESGIAGVSPEFLFIFGFIFLFLLMVAVFVRRSFDYFIVGSNEIVRKEGFLGDASRFNAVDVQIDKRISDVFESLLLFGSGDLTLKTNRGQEFHILNVPRINKVEKEIRRILGKIEVDTT